jgi:3-hydroxyacyl-CoA dehydrogenase
MTDIKKVAVIGAGVMGAGIAAHVANAGVPVLLLDIVPKDATNRNKLAEDAIDKLKKADPAPLMDRKNADLITPGNLDDHLNLLKDCDWIVEVVVEKLDVKQALYRKIDGVRRPGSIVSSNTSTIPLATLTQGLPDSFARDFLITHFFNPPRYMRLLEVVAGPKTRADALVAIRVFADVKLGKSVVPCKDTPGFIANRIGTYWLQCSVVEAMDQGLAIEEADAVLGRPIGVPKTGVFGLLDLVGLDLMPLVLRSLVGALPKSDPLHAIYREPELMKKMIADGSIGRKGKGGFYRLNTAGGGKVKESIDLKTGAYRPSFKPKLASVAESRKKGLAALVAHPDKGGRYARRVLARTLGYAASLIPEVADDLVAVDEAMRLGYAWTFGPFELIDKIGTARFVELLSSEGIAVPRILEVANGRSLYRVEGGRRQYLALDGAYRDVPRPEGVLLLEDIKRKSRPVAKNMSASLWDIGDGVLCLEFHSKMNSLNPLVLAMVRKAIRIIPGRYRALVVYNEATNFSVGANIGLLYYAAKLKLWPLIEFMVRQGQETYRALKYAPFPAVGAPSGMALGGGCEILLHCDAVQAHAESYVGLVEVGVGIIPGWGGCKEMLARWFANKKRPGGPMPPIIKVFEMLSTAAVAKSAAEAKGMLFLRPQDGVTMNRYRLLADAKARALALARDYKPPERPVVSLPGPSARLALEMAVDGFRKMGKATPHDVVVSKALAGVVSGGATDITETVDEEELLRLERQGFMALARHPASQARVGHMLKTGKPLRN